MSAMEPEVEGAGESLESAITGNGPDPFSPPGEVAGPDLPAVAAHEVALEPLYGLPGGGTGDDDLSLVLDVPVELSVEMGRATMTIRDTLAIGAGSIITLNRLVGEPVDLFANGRLIARGEVIAIDEEYGLRVTEVLTTIARAA